MDDSTKHNEKNDPELYSDEWIADMERRRELHSRERIKKLIENTSPDSIEK